MITKCNDMVAYCQRQGLTLRFIEAMPIGPGGQDAQDRYMPLSEVEEEPAGSVQIVACGHERQWARALFPDR